MSKSAAQVIWAADAQGGHSEEKYIRQALRTMIQSSTVVKMRSFHQLSHQAPLAPIYTQGRGVKISKARAEELVKALLFEMQKDGQEFAILGIKETPVGWVVAWNSAEYARSANAEHFLIGGASYLVDGSDGSIYAIPGDTMRLQDWQTIFLEEFKGLRRPDALLDSVQKTLQSDGRIAALRHLRKNATSLSLAQAKEYLQAVEQGNDPAEELVQLTRKYESLPPLPIRRVSGPVD
ncbi:hypothetical protein [Kitasatospora purpeofusca]|uniref:hypothetical protein n=1 Tax=Kitasatospora purpeofusca TaxID=67352 RepID=UPI00381A19DB